MRLLFGKSLAGLQFLRSPSKRIDLQLELTLQNSNSAYIMVALGGCNTLGLIFPETWFGKSRFFGITRRST